MSDVGQYRRLLAPRENGGTLFDPPLEVLKELLDENAQRVARFDYDFSGRELSQLRAQARKDLLHEALRHVRQYADVDDPPAQKELIFLAGHQPQLFHPGVWFKNFMLHSLAERYGAVAVNLTIDSDVVRGASLRVPGGSVTAPSVKEIALDLATDPIPFEQRGIIDIELFRSFGQRARRQLSSLVPDPLVDRLWPAAVEQAEETGNLGQSLTQSRHRLEMQWGSRTLEIPQSHICRTEAFHWFTAHLFARLPRFWEIYNNEVAEYRRIHRIRSAAHPVPNLTIEGDWLEAPFWIWDQSNPRRRPMFAKSHGEEILLTDRHQIEIRLQLTAEGEAHRAVGQLGELSQKGIHVRSRALLTTMFARLFLGDLFIHGIGGAKYDQLTNVLIQRFFGFEGPSFLVVSGTLHLPIQRQQVESQQARQVDRLLRELVFHPECYLDEADRTRDEVRELVSRKQQWIHSGIHSGAMGSLPALAESGAPRDARRRCHEIREVNELLQPYLADQREKLMKKREMLASALRAEAILSSREYAFCLYPEQTLLPWLQSVPGA